MSLGWHGGGGHHHHGGGGYWGPYWGGGYPAQTSFLYDLAQATLPCYVKTTGGYNTYNVNTQAECTTMNGSLTVPALKGFSADDAAASSSIPSWVLWAALAGVGVFLLARKH